MLKVETVAELEAHVGSVIGTSAWIEVTQSMIDLFAEATGDHQWIHLDRERAARELPGGTTIAHGYLTLSLLPRMSAEVLEVARKSRSLNYGSNKVRFLTPVPSGAKVRLVQTLKAFEAVPGGARLVLESVVEIEGKPKPALSAETIRLTYD